MEKVRQEDGFNIVAIQCDGCGQEISQVKDANSDWFEVTVSPLARDQWNAGDDYGEFHFCSRSCFEDAVDNLSLNQQENDNHENTSR